MSENISLYEHAVRRVRRELASGEDPKITLANYKRNLAIDPQQCLADAKKPGPIDGYPYMAKARGVAESAGQS